MNKYTQQLLNFILMIFCMVFLAFSVYAAEKPESYSHKEDPSLEIKKSQSARKKPGSKSDKKSIKRPGKKVKSQSKKNLTSGFKKHSAKKKKLIPGNALIINGSNSKKKTVKTPSGSPAKNMGEASSGDNKQRIVPERGPRPLKLNLEKSVELAEAGHPDIKIYEARIEAAKGSYRVAKSAQKFKLGSRGSFTRIDPVSEITLGLDPNKPPQKIKLGSENNFSGQIVLEKIITTFGNLENTISASSFNIAAARENLQRIRQQIKYDVKEDYFSALRAYGQIQITRENLDLVRDQLKKTNDMYDAGVVPRFEIIRNELFVSQARQSLITARKNYELSLSSLLDTLNLDLETPVELRMDYKVNRIKVELAKSRKKALENRHELKSLKFSLEAATRLLHAAMNGRNPTVSFQSIVENKTVSGLASEPTTWTTMLVVSLPIFDGGKSDGQTKQARASLDELKQTYKKEVRRVKLDVKRAVLTIKEVEAKLDASERDVATAQAAYAIALARYENGISTGLELDDARKSLNGAKIRYLNMQFEYHVAVAKLEKVTATAWKGEDR